MFISWVFMVFWHQFLHCNLITYIPLKYWTGQVSGQRDKVGLAYSTWVELTTSVWLQVGHSSLLVSSHLFCFYFRQQVVLSWMFQMYTLLIHCLNYLQQILSPMWGCWIFVCLLEPVQVGTTWLPSQNTPFEEFKEKKYLVEGNVITTWPFLEIQSRCHLSMKR